MLDCLIVGAGPAGLTAANYLARYRRSACVIDSGNSRAALIPESHNYPGFKGIGGPELIQRLRDQLLQYDASVETGEVNQLRRGQDAVFIANLGAREIQARYVILATGLIDARPRIEGLHDPDDAIRFCPICDGYEAMDQRVAILGGRDAIKKAKFMRTYTPHVFLFSTDKHAEQIQGDLNEAGITYAGKPVRVEKSNGHLAITVDGGKRYEVDVLYPALGCDVRSELATALGARCTDIGSLIVDEHQQTTLDGLYAAGDVVSDLHQLNVATAHAAIAATQIHNRLPPNPR